MAGVQPLMTAPLALFRCDASPVIGAGHVTRCMALAEALAEAGWRVGFAVGSETIPTVPALAASGFKVRVLADASLDVEALREEASGQADLLVVDHYQRDVAFEKACRFFARKILVLDDATGRDHDCDVLVDAAATSAELYAVHVPDHAQVLIGPSYALMRRSFVLHRDTALARRDGRPVSEILVSCGATDPSNATAIVLDALADVVGDVVVTVVLSSRAPHVDAVRKHLQGKARLLLDAEDMAGLMTNADLAIGAPGSTSYERAVLGLPSILVTLADNQRGIAATMVDAGAALGAGAFDAGLAERLQPAVKSLLGDSKGRLRLTAASSRVVDGRGATRIMIECLGGSVTKDGTAIRLRLADASDEAWLLELQRRPGTRRFYRNPAIPSASEHHDWMSRTLTDPARLLLVLKVAAKPVGVLRLDRRPDDGGKARHEVSIAVDPDHANRGIGAAALGLARRLLPSAQFEAEISPENVASQRAFIRAGYQPLGAGRYRNMASISENR
jgi:UDP-2,4-diacetamido-2,4,6-trideoxy-beta-L-altropyranose hydrolase